MHIALEIKNLGKIQTYIDLKSCVYHLIWFITSNKDCLAGKPFHSPKQENMKFPYMSSKMFHFNAKLNIQHTVYQHRDCWCYRFQFNFELVFYLVNITYLLLNFRLKLRFFFDATTNDDDSLIKRSQLFCLFHFTFSFCTFYIERKLKLILETICSKILKVLRISFSKNSRLDLDNAQMNQICVFQFTNIQSM